MNSLTWLLYAINVIGNVGFAFQWFLGISICLAILVFISCFLKMGDYGPEPTANKSKKPIAWMLIPVVILALTVALFPSQRTLYLMAASEIGERVVKSEKVQGLVDPTIETLQNYIKLENRKIKRELDKLLDKDRD